MSRILRVGVMSFARPASPYVEHLLAEDGIELLSSDSDGSREELMSGRPDAVLIGEQGSRLDAVRVATEAGAHILCVGPLATTSAGAEEMVRLAADAGVLLMTGSALRATGTFRTLAARVRRGDVGEVLGVLGSSTGAFPVDLLDALLGEPASWVRAGGGVVTIGYPSGSFATVDGSGSLSGAESRSDVRLQVTGTRGSISMNAAGRHVEEATGDGVVRLPFGTDPERSMLRHFLACVRGGDTAESDGPAGLRATRIVEASLESTATGRTVRLSA